MSQNDSRHDDSVLSNWFFLSLAKLAAWVIILLPLYSLLRMAGGSRLAEGLWWRFLSIAVGVAGLAFVAPQSAKFRFNRRVSRYTNRFSRFSRYALAVILLVGTLFPIYWMAISSLLPSARVMRIPPTLTLTIDSGIFNYVKVFSKPEYIRYFINSFITSGGTVLAIFLIALPAGFAFSRYRFVGKNLILTTIMSVQMFPIVVILISLYGFYTKWGLLNTYLGVILADTTFALPLAITLMRSFFDTLPRSLDESACLDGAGRIYTMLHILVPLTLPGLVAVGVYTFLSAWDDFLMALTIMITNDMKTLTVGLAQSFLGEYAHDYGALMAFAMAGSMPIVLVFVFFQKYMISGLTAGAVKG